MKISSARFDNPFLVGLICATLAMVLYALTIAPTFSWGDSADLAMRLVYDADQSFVGTHREYMLWRLAGQAAAWLPTQDVGLRANLFTAFWGAVTIGAVAVFVQVISHSTIAAFAAASSLAVAHSFWLLSVIAEVYTFNAALVFLTFTFIAIWWETDRAQWIWLAAFFAGLSLLHHATGLVLVASCLPLVGFRIRSIGLTNGFLSLCLFIFISIPYWLSVFPRISSDVGLLDALGLRMTQNVNFETSVPREALKFAAYLTFNFIGIGVILGATGLASAIKTRVWAVLPPLIWGSAFIFAGLISSIPDKFNVYVLVYPSFSILVGLGTALVVKRFSLRQRGAAAILTLLLLTPPIGYATATRVSSLFDIDLIGARVAPFRDNALYFLWPPKNGDYGPRNFAERALSDVPDGSFLLADYTLWRPLYFMQAVESFHTDVEIIFVERLFSGGVDNWIAQQPSGRRIFLATIDPPQYYQLHKIEDRFGVSQFRSVYEVERGRR